MRLIKDQRVTIALETAGITIAGMVNKVIAIVIVFILVIVFITLGLASFAIGGTTALTVKTLTPVGMGALMEKKGVQVEKEVKTYTLFDDAEDNE